MSAVTVTCSVCRESHVCTTIGPVTWLDFHYAIAHPGFDRTARKVS